MANEQYTVAAADRADATVFTVPGDEDGGVGDVSFFAEDKSLNDSHDTYVHVENGFDVSVDVTLQGSHWDDETMTAAVADGTAITIASGNQDFFDSVSSHSYLEVSVDPATTPTTGNLVVTFQSREA